ncbi:hypothetical protein FQA47_010468 [Oryzias melastigma]|uniref:Uncharacterized protein n=1 Tax=Oryzias melastigma TaxID=30732 RepID=A0A834BT48_ORYME|nr:hypothetical protein FQA47_010468 [Oryzias melastigma]
MVEPLVGVGGVRLGNDSLLNSSPAGHGSQVNEHRRGTLPVCFGRWKLLLLNSNTGQNTKNSIVWRRLGTLQPACDSSDRVALPVSCRTCSARALPPGSCGNDGAERPRYLLCADDTFISRVLVYLPGCGRGCERDPSSLTAWSLQNTAAVVLKLQEFP